MNLSKKSVFSLEQGTRLRYEVGGRGASGLHVAYDKAWELTGPDVAFCTRSVFSPLLLGLHIPVTFNTRVTRRTCFTTLVFRPPSTIVSLCSSTSTLSRTTINDLPLCGFQNNYDFIHDRSITVHHPQIV